MTALRRRWAAIALPVAVAAAVGCSSYSRQSPLLREAMARDDYEAALAQVEKIDRSTSELLYCYEKGLVLHEQGDYAGSNQVFERAERVLEELYTKSITREVAAVVVSETISKYRGDAFEAVLVNYYKLLNYLFLGQMEDALVECRRLNGKLQMLHDAGETYFVDDPFLQYLTALVYELGGEPESAEVSFRAAAQGYGSADSTLTPAGFACDAAANARAVGDAALAREYGMGDACDGAPADAGRVAVLVEDGSIARKIETSFTVPIFEDDRADDGDRFCQELSSRRNVHYDHPPKVKYWLRVALPALQVDPPAGLRTVVRAVPEGEGRGVDPREAQARRVEDLDAQAARAYADKEPTVVLRAIARALAKYLASQSADKHDEAFGAIVNLLGVVTETADTRSWTTLPRSIRLARLDLEPGIYRIETEIFGPRGNRVGHDTFDGVDVRSGGLVVRRVRVR